MKAPSLLFIKYPTGILNPTGLLNTQHAFRLIRSDPSGPQMSAGSIFPEGRNGTTGGMGEFRWLVNRALNKSESKSEKLHCFLKMFKKLSD